MLAIIRGAEIGAGCYLPISAADLGVRRLAAIALLLAAAIAGAQIAPPSRDQGEATRTGA